MSDDLIELLLESELNMDHGAWATCKEAAVEILRLRAKNAKLRAALKPFADAWEDRDRWQSVINIDDLRAAAAAYKETGGMSDSYLPDNEPRDILSSLEELAARKLSHAPTFRKAAAEILRLHAEIEELRKDAAAAWALCASISAENEKLRAAKVELLRLFDEAMDGYADCMPYKGYYLIGKHGDKENFDDLRSAAAALKETGND